MGGETLAKKRDRLLAAHPGYCTVTTVAKMIGTSRWGVRRHTPKIKHILVEEMILYDIQSALEFSRQHKAEAKFISVVAFKGVDAERIKKICEKYYRTQYDTAPKHLLALAKKTAGL